MLKTIPEWTRVLLCLDISEGGTPTARDRVTASRMGNYAVRCFVEVKQIEQ